MALEADQLMVHEPPRFTAGGFTTVVTEGVGQEASEGGGALQEPSTTVPSLVMPQELAAELHDTGVGAGGACEGRAGAGHTVPGGCAAEQVPLHRMVPYSIWLQTV